MLRRHGRLQKYKSAATVAAIPADSRIPRNHVAVMTTAFNVDRNVRKNNGQKTCRVKVHIPPV